MTESEATDWLQQNFPNVSRETWDRLQRFESLVRLEAGRQNLVADSTLSSFSARHIVDSAQLLTLKQQQRPTRWLDIGSGAGFPGLVVALLSEDHVTLVEERKLRAEFLRRAVSILELHDRVVVRHSRIERVQPESFDYITARAFAALPKLLPLAHPFSTENTRWLLPKGRSAQTEVDQVRATWQGEFRLEASVSDPEAWIIVAANVAPRTNRPDDRRAKA